jgi:purine-binding chemotaxis protein CheW
MIIFKVGAEEFAVDILLVKEVVMMRDITAVPETDRFVEGVMNLRGTLIPVLDLRKRLKASRVATGIEQRILIVLHQTRLLGLIVDGASEVARISRDMVEPAPDIIRELDAEYIAGIINLEGRFVTLLDLGRALTGEITSALDQVVAALAQSASGLAPARAL